MIYLDINKFKQINDEYGHDYGDELLIKFASNLEEGKRKNDFCARLGGDEFALILEHIDASQKIEEVFESYEKKLSKSYTIKGVTLNVTASGGVALYPETTTEFEEVLQKADKAMYQSKKKGDGKFVISDK